MELTGQCRIIAIMLNYELTPMGSTTYGGTWTAESGARSAYLWLRFFACQRRLASLRSRRRFSAEHRVEHVNVRGETARRCGWIS